MSIFPNDYKISVDPMRKTPFLKHTGIRCDGTTPLYRDVDGRLWTINGHSNDGRIAMFCGNTIDDMKELYTIKLNFCDGHADYAFDGIKYPEGIKARGCIWPFGLYICPGTHRFFCFFHNETAWRPYQIALLILPARRSWQIWRFPRVGTGYRQC